MEESIRPGGLNLPTCFTSSTGTVVASTNYPNADPMEDVEGDDEEEEDDDNDDSKDDDFNEESALGSSNRPSSMATAKASPATAKKWTPTEDSLLVDAVNRYGDHRWKDVARFVGTRNPGLSKFFTIKILSEYSFDPYSPMFTKVDPLFDTRIS